MAKRSVIVVGVLLVVVTAWVGAGSLSGRGFGFGERDCTLTSGTAADGVLEGQARCKWPVAVDRVDAVLAAWGDQSQYFGNVAESHVVGQRGDRTLVRQIYRARGIEDREVVMECFTEAIPGGRRYHWHKASDQSGNSGRNIEIAVHEGFWEVRGDEHSTTVEYHMRYLPGGNVPQFLVSMFLSSGIEAAMTDLRRAAAGSTRVAAAGSGGA